MEEGETVSILSRKELRKQKLMEYLAAKGRLKHPNPKLFLHDDSQVKKPATSAPKVVKGKENKAPADAFRYEGTKVQTLVAQSTKQPVRRAFGFTNKVNVKGNLLTGQQNAKRPCATGGPAQPKLNQNLGVLGKGITVSSKSNLNAVSHPKKQPITGKKFTGRDSVSVRMSLGPIVKTKTGLIPAVTQPRNTMSHLTHTSAKASITPNTMSLATKLRSHSSSSISLSQRSAMAQRKTLPTTSLNTLVNERATVSSTARAGIKVQDQNKSKSKPLTGKHSQAFCKSQLSIGMKSVPTSKGTAIPFKPDGRGEMSKSIKLAGKPIDRTKKQKSEGRGETNIKPCKVTSETTVESVSRCDLSTVSGAKGAAEPVGKTRTCEETLSRMARSSANASAPLTGFKKTIAPVMSHTVPRPTRTIGRTGQAADMKMPKVPPREIPQTEKKKVTASQEERMRKLQEWRETKGISYKRPPIPVKPQVRRTLAVSQPFWTTMNEEDEAQSLICAVDRSLADCIKLLGEGCPADRVKEVLSRLPTVSQKFVKYWICQVRLMEQEGNLDVLPMFEEAVRVVLEPVDELRTVVFEILKKKDEIQASEASEKEGDQIPTVESSPENNNSPMLTPKPIRALICGETGDSSIVKYKITATPGGPASQQREPPRVNGQEVRFFTPVRRSVRIERALVRYPASLQDHDHCVASYNELISEQDREKSEEQEGGETSPSASDMPMYIYRQNEALKDKVFVQLVYD